MTVLYETPTWPIHTARLSLRPATRDDLEATWSFRRLPEVSLWLTRAPATLEDYREQFLDRDSLIKTVIIELDDQVIGDLMLDVHDGWGQAEVADDARSTQADLGWALHPQHTGHGYATEAVQALLKALLAEEVGDHVTGARLANHATVHRAGAARRGGDGFEVPCPSMSKRVAAVRRVCDEQGPDNR